MKKNSFILFLFTIIFSNINGQFLPEASLEERANFIENGINFEEIKGYSFASDIPASYSLENYTIVMDQRDASSCTGYAIAGAMNTMYNYFNNTTNITEKLANRFDPEYIYCALKDDSDLDCISGNGCKCGSFIFEGVDLVMEYGCKKIGLNPSLKCGTTLNKKHLTKLAPITMHYSIDFPLLFVKWEKKDDKNYYNIDIEGMKLAISYGFPLITGIYTSDKFDDLSLVYSPANEPTGPHAITIIGYNDNYLGGSFRVLNSYGKEWGDNGYFWIKYDDLVNNFAASNVYALFKEDGDFSSWLEEVRTSDFYKGELASGKYWEGPMNENYKCHGRGILRGNNYSALASYEDGIANGWWLYMGDYKDSFFGWLLYEDGQIIEEDGFGFVSENNQFIINNSKNLVINNNKPDIDFIEAFEEDVTNSGIKEQKNKFNYNKKNNYKK